MFKVRRMVGSLLAAAALVAASGSVARAHGHERRPHLTRSAPEIDPIAGGAMIAVLVGGTLVIAAHGAGRRRRAARL